MWCAPVLIQLVCLALGSAAIEITNKELDVQPGVDFEITWKDAGGDRVDIDLYTWPIWSHVVALSRGKTQYVKEFSTRVLVPEDIEPRVYAFKATEWPSGQSDFSEGFFFNGTGGAATASLSSEGTASPTESETTSLPSGTASNTPGDVNVGGGEPVIHRSRPFYLNPLILTFIVLGALLFVAIVAGCFVCSHRSKKKQRIAAETEMAERHVPKTQAVPTGNQERAEDATASEKPTDGPREHGIREYYAMGAQGNEGNSPGEQQPPGGDASQGGTPGWRRVLRPLYR